MKNVTFKNLEMESPISLKTMTNFQRMVVKNQD